MSGAGLEAQRAAIAEECERRGWEIVATLDDRGLSAKDLKRPGIQEALQILAEGRADALVVSKLDRLSRSMLDFTNVMNLAQKQGWAVVALDCAVDTTSPAGEAMASVLATFAQFERRLIGQRTKDALAAKRAAGVKLGRPRTLPPSVRKRILKARAKGTSFAAIADDLNADGVATAQGGAKWWPETVRGIVLAEGVA